MSGARHTCSPSNKGIRNVDCSYSMFLPFVFLLLLICGGAFFIGYINSQLHLLQNSSSLNKNLVFFLIINLNIVVIMVLGFLVVRNLVKLFVDRRKRKPGSRLRSRLVMAFVGLSFVPTVLLFMISKVLLATVLQGWFSPQISAAVDGAVAVAQYHYAYREEELSSKCRLVVVDLEKQLSVLNVRRSNKLSSESSDSLEWNYALTIVLEQTRKKLGINQLTLLDSFGNVLARSFNAGGKGGGSNVLEPQMAAVRDAAFGRIVVHAERSFDTEYLRGYAPVDVGSAFSVSSGVNTKDHEQSDSSEVRYTGFVVMLSQEISRELSQRLMRVIESYDDYKELRITRRPLASTYLLLLVGVTLLIVFAAIWVGFYLAKTLSDPIQEIAEGTQQVAKGNLDYRIPESGDDEISLLVQSFNTMTEDLQGTTAELVSRRQYMETVLERVSVGVLSVDIRKRITTCNTAASVILGIDIPEKVIGQESEAILPESVANHVSQLFERLLRSESSNIAEFAFSGEVHSRHIQVSIASLVDSNGVLMGAVILVDDFTELVKAQRMAAWREVARRIAHEIKNPLTPIQLSAQRIQRRFEDVSKGGKGSGRLLSQEERSLLSNATRGIIEQVEVLRRLVNEFSKFARMPKINIAETNVAELVYSTVRMYQEAHSDICFSVEMDKRIQTMMLDKEQMGRALVNLLDNAVAAVQNVCEDTEERKSCNKVPKPVVKIVSDLNETLGMVSISVSDNGPGISIDDRARVFEPYFSTKKGGAGLGLAIINSIVADHNGFVRIRDVEGGGACVVIELPLKGL